MINQVQTVTVYALVVFSMLMIVIGILSSKKTKTMEGFLLGNRQIGPWVSAFAYGTSYFSAVIFIGYAGQHGWNIGLGSIWIGIGNAVLGCMLAWLIMAKRTRRITHDLGAKTTPEFFEARYESTGMKVYSAIIIFLFLVPYSAAVYKGLGSLFNTIFPSASIEICMGIVAVLTAIYLVFGGYVATVYTDFVQGIIMIFGVIVMVFGIVNNQNVGGFVSGYHKIKEINPTLVSWYGGNSWKFLCINILLTSFGTWGLPQMITKYYAIKDDKSIKTATIVSTVFALIIGCGAYYIGSLGRLFVETGEKGLPIKGFDMVVPQTLMNSLGLDGNILTTIVLAIIMLLLLSASMSTLSSIVLTSSSAITVDFIPVVNPAFQGKKQMITTRVLCFIFVLLSYIFATANISFIVNLMSFSWGVVAGCFIGPVLLGLYWKKTTKTGAWYGLFSGVGVVGILTVVFTALYDYKTAMTFSPQFGVLAMAVSLIMTWVVSLCTKDIPEDAVKTAFSK